MSNSDYSFIDQMLHRLALQFDSVAEISFDLDQNLVKTNPNKIVSKRHVFVSGLARAGTTILMRQFYETGLYRSLTYRDMPFVLAPNLWSRISSISKRESKNAERAHGDNLIVNVDSPESLDEVFWRVFSGEEYINKSLLKPHEPSAEVIQKYICYVNAILSTHAPQRELYLSKNNNNILRLGAIHKAFPNALIIIPFRDPLQHAHSLFRQHNRFSKMQRNNRFTLSYMTWLVHHEFGLDHRPFCFDDSVLSKYTPDSLNYWLQLWCHTYSWLENSKPEGAVFVCYEDLCSQGETWQRLAKLAGIPVTETNNSFKASSHQVTESIDEGLMGQTSLIYERLKEQSRAQLS